MADLARDFGAWLGQAERLTPRQREIVDLAAQGVPLWEIAHQLGVTLSCVQSTLSHIRARLGRGPRRRQASSAPSPVRLVTIGYRHAHPAFLRKLHAAAKTSAWRGPEWRPVREFVERRGIDIEVRAPEDWPDDDLGALDRFLAGLELARFLTSLARVVDTPVWTQPDSVWRPVREFVERRGIDIEILRSGDPGAWAAEDLAALERFQAGLVAAVGSPAEAARARMEEDTYRRRLAYRLAMEQRRPDRREALALGDRRADARERGRALRVVARRQGYVVLRLTPDARKLLAADLAHWGYAPVDIRDDISIWLIRKRHAALLREAYGAHLAAAVAAAGGAPASLPAMAAEAGVAGGLPRYDLGTLPALAERGGEHVRAEEVADPPAPVRVPGYARKVHQVGGRVVEVGNGRLVVRNRTYACPETLRMCWRDAGGRWVMAPLASLRPGDSVQVSYITIEDERIAVRVVARRWAGAGPRLVRLDPVAYARAVAARLKLGASIVTVRPGPGLAPVDVVMPGRGSGQTRRLNRWRWFGMRRWRVVGTVGAGRWRAVRRPVNKG